MRYILSILTILIPLVSLGQENYCNAYVDKKFVGQNERFKYEITTNLDCEIVPPDFESVGLQIVGGPMQGSSSNYSNINGKARFVVENSLAYHLIATEKGAILIPPAQVKCANETFTSETIKVNVSEDSPANAMNDAGKDHFLKAVPNKEEVYEGEPFTVALKFYSKKRPNNFQVEIGTGSPMFRENLYKNKQNYTIDQEIVDGERYYVTEIYKDLCIPLTPGLAELQSYYAAIEIPVSFFNNNWLEAYSNTVSVKAKELPKPKPPNFNGLVGKFDMIHSIDKTTLTVGEVIDMKIRIDGTGNFNAFDDPQLNFPDAFHVFDPESERDLILTENGFTGSIEYHFVISPDEAGDFVIAPFSFSYFDLTEGKYKSLTTQEFHIHVKEGKRDYVDYGKGPDAQMDDIEYIEPESSPFFTMGDFLFGTMFYWLMLIVPIGLSTGFVLIKKRQANRSTEQIVENQQKEAKKAIFKELKSARKLIGSGQESQATKALQQSLVNYFMVKLNLSLSSLSRQAISAQLKAKNVDEETIGQFGALWDKIEMAQYAPMKSANLEQTVTEVEELVKILNNKL